MNHKITIKNLGPIKKITNFEVRRINAVIGESATGKSLLAKAIYCFNVRQFTHWLPRDLDRAKSELKGNLQWLFDSYVNFSITYYYTNDYSILITKQRNITIKLSDGLKERTDEIERKVEAIKKDSIAQIPDEFLKNLKEDIPQSEFEKLVSDVPVATKERLAVIDKFMKELGILETIFIPDNRTLVNEFDEMRLMLFDRPGFYPDSSLDYIPDNDMTLTAFSGLYRRYLKRFKSLSHPLMRGEVRKINDQMVKFYVDDQELDISEISSGQKEMFPILMILQELKKRKTPYLVIVEENETHIYPEDQKKLLDHIIEVANATGSSVFITTHSPYVLMAMNNLMEAKSRGYPKLKDKFIDLKETTVARLENGTIEDLMDPEEELIDLGPIESVNNTIIGEFENILNYEPK